ncbi:FxSxx-COOH cyclophane-containing RiPP peptide [Streptosporangium sp. NPDC001681]|uniref:FxSxx-COOH cyclophane-containing RiPP peptide n=1 Tax=unclassified Streptosporangium TaxID=2632669 RepID=UPI003324F0BA
MSEEAATANIDSGKGLIDLTGLNLADLDKIGDSILDLVRRRIAADGDAGPVAGFDSSI